MIETMTQSVPDRGQATDEEVIEKLPTEVGILLIVAGLGASCSPGRSGPRS